MNALRYRHRHAGHTHEVSVAEDLPKASHSESNCQVNALGYRDRHAGHKYGICGQGPGEGIAQ